MTSIESIEGGGATSPIIMSPSLLVSTAVSAGDSATFHLAPLAAPLNERERRSHPQPSASRRNGGESRSILTVVTDNARIPTMAQALAMTFESVPATSPFQVRHERSTVAVAPWRERSARTDAHPKKCSLDNTGGTLPLRRSNTRRALRNLIQGFWRPLPRHFPAVWLWATKGNFYGCHP